MGLARWPFRRVALVVFGWILVTLGGMVFWTTLASRQYVGTDTYVIVVHLHRWIALILGPPALLVVLWLWRRP